jgi:hypothetical protein
MPWYSAKYSIPLKMLKSVQQIWREGTMMRAGNILKPCMTVPNTTWNRRVTHH